MKLATRSIPLAAVFDSRVGAEEAVELLQRARLGVRRLSIVAKNFRTEEHEFGVYSSRDPTRFMGGRGAVATLVTPEAGALAADLTRLGVPEARALRHETEVMAGKYLVLAVGPDDLVERARLAGVKDDPLPSGAP